MQQGLGVYQGQSMAFNGMAWHSMASMALPRAIMAINGMQQGLSVHQKHQHLQQHQKHQHAAPKAPTCSTKSINMQQDLSVYQKHQHLQ